MREKFEQLLSHQGFQKYFKNTLWLFVEKIVRIIVGMILIIWVARYLGPAKFGILSYAQSFVGLFAGFAALGLDSIVVRELVKDDQKHRELVGTAFYLKLLGAIVTVVVIGASLYITSNDYQNSRIILIVASAMVFNSFLAIDFYYQAKVRSKFAVLANLISLLVSSIIKIILILIEAPLLAFAWMILFDSIILALAFVYCYQLNVSSIRKWKFDINTAKRLLRDSWPLIPHKAAFMVIANIDQVMIHYLMNNHEVGIYSMPYRIIMIIYSFLTIFCRSIFPALVKEGEIQDNRFIMLYRLMIFIPIIVFIAYYLLGRKLLTIVFGAEFYDSVKVFNLLIVSVLFSSLSVATGKWYIVNNFTKLFLFRTITGAIINIVLDFYLIQKFGIQGAAYATIVAFFYISYLSNYFHKATFKNLELIHGAIYLNWKRK